VEVLRTVQTLSGDCDLVFPSPFYPSKSWSENTFNSALARMGFKGIATAHGFRALFFTVANECNWALYALCTPTCCCNQEAMPMAWKVRTSSSRRTT
jgi:hypothetical protein